MSQNNFKNIGVVVLAAGKGTRLNRADGPKVMAPVGGRPLISYTVATLQSLGLAADKLCLVVGYQKEQIMSYFGSAVTYATQDELLGTAHAAYTGMKGLPPEVDQVLILGGDDSAFYKGATLARLLHAHIINRSVLTLLITAVEDPAALGRIVRHPDGRVEIIEKEYLTAEQKLINEISTGTFVFDQAWFENMFPVMPKLRKLGEYGLPTALAVARESGQRYELVRLPDNNEWFGVNTPEQLAEADQRKRLMV